MLTAQEVITAARDQHPAFDRNSHPDLTLLRQLSNYQRELIGKALIRYPDLFSEDQVVALPLAVFADGIPLDSPLMIHDVEGVATNGRGFEITIIPAEHRHGPRPARAVYILGRILYQCGLAMDWSGAAQLTIKYSKTVPALVAMTDAITLQDEAQTPLAAHLCLLMAGRGTQRSDITPPSVSLFAGMKQAAEEDFLRSLWLQRSASSAVRREVS